MKQSRITIKRPADPFHDLIQARIAARKAKEKREPVPAAPVGPEALYDLAEFVRANTVAVLIMEAR